MAKKNLAQRTYDNTLKAKRWFQGTRNDLNQILKQLVKKVGLVVYYIIKYLSLKNL